MALVKIKDFYHDHQNVSDDQSDIKNFDVYAQGEDKVGHVNDLLVDEVEGRIRYLILDTGFWVFGKKVLLPIGLAQIDYSDKRVNVRSLTKDQVENLPNVDDNLQKIDEEHEEQVRGVYRPQDQRSETTVATTADASAVGATSRGAYQYDQNPDLYNTSDRDHQSLKLYEERLIADKQRQKTGEVTIGKRVETSTVGVAVPLEKERVIVERMPVDQQAVDPAIANFQEGEVERIEVYEETPDIRKEAFVREEVQVRKEVEQDTATVSDQVRREELDVNTQGRPAIEQ